jgi:SAM-dependent methyltransferase
VRKRGEVLGAIDSTKTRNGHLLIRGWIRTSSRIDGFQVFASHTELSNISWKYGLRKRRTAHGGEKPRFEIRVPIPSRAKQRFRDCLICATPLLRNGRGESLFTILKPSLRLPPKRDLRLFVWDFLPEAYLGLKLLVNDAGLRRDESVLDIGCGPGRIPYVLSYFLSARGQYEGIDPVTRWIRHNQSVFHSRFRNFRFKQLSIQNPLYNPKGTVKAAKVRLPYGNDTFDVVFLGSVLQHNQAKVAKHYLSEIARILRPGGRCLITCFLLDRDRAQPRRSKEALSFPHALKDCWANNTTLPETGIAFLERDFCQWAADQELLIQKKVRGSWHGPSAKLYQDMVILKKL